MWINIQNTFQEWTRIISRKIGNGPVTFFGRPYRTGSPAEVTADRSLGPDILLYPGQPIRLHASGYEDDTFNDDDAGLIEDTRQQVAGVPYKSDNVCGTNCTDYILEYRIDAGTPFPAPVLSQVARASFDSFRIDASDLTTPLPSQPLLLDDEFLFRRAAREEKALTNIDLEELRSLLASEQANDPEGVDAFVQELRAEVDRWIASEGLEGIGIDLHQMRELVPINVWNKYFGNLPSDLDLTVTQTVSPQPAIVGKRLTYTIRVTNNGPGEATGIGLLDTLPAGVTFVSARPSQGTCSAIRAVSCELGTLARGRSATVEVEVLPISPGDVTNTVLVSPRDLDLLGENIVRTTTTVQAPPAITPGFAQIAKGASVIAVAPGDVITFTVTLVLGSPRQGVVVEDIFSGGGKFPDTGFVPGSAKVNGVPTGDPVLKFNQLNRVHNDFNLGNLGAGTHTLTYQWKVSSGLTCSAWNGIGPTLIDEVHLDAAGVAGHLSTSTLQIPVRCSSGD